MRTETKIALGLFVVAQALRYFLSTPEFISGLLFGLSLFFLIIGLLPESAYVKLKERQSRKLSFLKRLAKQN